MVCQNLRQAYHLMQVLIDHETLFIIDHVQIHVDLSSMIVFMGS